MIASKSARKVRSFQMSLVDEKFVIVVVCFFVVGVGVDCRLSSLSFSNDSCQNIRLFCEYTRSGTKISLEVVAWLRCRHHSLQQLSQLL